MLQEIKAERTEIDQCIVIFPFATRVPKTAQLLSEPADHGDKGLIFGGNVTCNVTEDLSFAHAVQMANPIGGNSQWLKDDSAYFVENPNNVTMPSIRSDRVTYFETATYQAEREIVSKAGLFLDGKPCGQAAHRVLAPPCLGEMLLMITYEMA